MDSVTLKVERARRYPGDARLQPQPWMPENPTGTNCLVVELRPLAAATARQIPLGSHRGGLLSRGRFIAANQVIQRPIEEITDLIVQLLDGVKAYSH